MNVENFKQGEEFHQEPDQEEEIETPENLECDIKLSYEQSELAHKIIVQKRNQLNRKIVDLEKNGLGHTQEHNELVKECVIVEKLLDIFYSSESDDDESDWVDNLLKIRPRNPGDIKKE